MLNFLDSDIKIINDNYRAMLLNLKDYLQHYNVRDVITYSEIVINMLHDGLFSMQRIIEFNNDYDYLNLPFQVSQGVQVTYGVCCCRHATEFMYNLLCILNFNPSLLYVYIDDKSGCWHRVNPQEENANHQVILIDNQYIIDAVNRLILEINGNGELHPINFNYDDYVDNYHEDKIEVIGNVLEKYYTYKRLGVNSVYS